MAIIQSELGKFCFNVILTVLMVYGFKMLWSSAKQSLKNSGGKWTSIIDEGIIGLAGLAVLVMCWNFGPVGTVELFITWVQWAWKMISPILRNLGFPV